MTERSIVLCIHFKDLFSYSSSRPQRNITSPLGSSSFQKFHTVYYKLFYIDYNHPYLFTPLIYAVIILLEILDYCGSLLNVLQFLPERVIGKLGGMENTSRRLDTHSLSHTLQHICIRLMDDIMPIASTSISDHSIPGADRVFESV